MPEVSKQTVESKTKKKRRKGIRFPLHDLKTAIEVSQKVYDDGGGRLQRNVLAKYLHLSHRGSPFIGRVAAAKHFGLVTEKEGIVTNTPLAAKIISPISDKEKEESLIEAFIHYDVFAKLVSRFADKELPDIVVLANIVDREYGVSPASKALFAKNFISSGKEAGVLREKNGKLFCQDIGLEKYEEEIPPKPVMPPKELRGKIGRPEIRPFVSIGINVTPGMPEKEIRRAVRIILDEIRKMSEESE